MGNCIWNLQTLLETLLLPCFLQCFWKWFWYCLVSICFQDGFTKIPVSLSINTRRDQRHFSNLSTSKMYFYKSSSWSILRKMEHDRQSLTGWVQMGTAERTKIWLCIWIICKKVAKYCLMAIRLCFHFGIDHLWSFSLQIVLQSLQKGVITVDICSLYLDSKMSQDHQEEKACLQR